MHGWIAKAFGCSKTMALAQFLQSDDGFGAVPQRAVRDDPLALNGAYDLSHIRARFTGQLGNVAAGAGFQVGDAWATVADHVEAENVFTDITAVRSNFHTHMEIRQRLTDFFAFLFSEDGLALRLEDIEGHWK